MAELKRLVKVGSAEERRVSHTYQKLQAERRTFKSSFDGLERERKSILAKYKLNPGASKEENNRYLGLAVAFISIDDNGRMTNTVSDDEVDDFLSSYSASLRKRVKEMNAQYRKLAEFKRRIEGQSDEYNEAVRAIRYQ